MKLEYWSWPAWSTVTWSLFWCYYSRFFEASFDKPSSGFDCCGFGSPGFSKSSGKGPSLNTCSEEFTPPLMGTKIILCLLRFLVSWVTEKGPSDGMEEVLVNQDRTSPWVAVTNRRGSPEGTVLPSVSVISILAWLLIGLLSVGTARSLVGVSGDLGREEVQAISKMKMSVLEVRPKRRAMKTLVRWLRRTTCWGRLLHGVGWVTPLQGNRL